MTIDDIKKLSPKERLKKLKELQEEDKKELEEAEELIKQSIHDVEQEDIEKIVRRIKKPELRKVEVKDLFENKNDVSIEEKVKISVKLSEEQKRRSVSYDQNITTNINQNNLASFTTYDKVRELANKAYDGNLSKDEEENLNFYQSQFQNVNPEYLDGEEKKVIEKTEDLLDRIKKYQ